MKKDNIKNLTIDQLFLKINTDTNYEKEFYERFKLFIRKYVNKFNLSREEKEDLIQEGMIGLFKAIKTYVFDKNTKFSTYAKVCIENNIKNCLNDIYKQKAKLADNQVLESMTIKNNPEKDIIIKDYTEMIKEFIMSFEELELNILKRYLEGISYTEIANEFSINEKKVDNVLQKIKKRLVKYVKNKVNDNVKAFDFSLIMETLKKILF